MILQGLKRAETLNGRHGCVGGQLDEQTGRYPIDLDLVDPSLKRVMAKPENLQRELTRNRPDVSTGKMEVATRASTELNGPSICFIVLKLPTVF